MSTSYNELRNSFFETLYQAGGHASGLADELAEHALEFANDRCFETNELLINEIKKLKNDWYYKEQKYLEEIAISNSIIQNTSEDNLNYSDVAELKRELMREKQRNIALQKANVVDKTSPRLIPPPKTTKSSVFEDFFKGISDEPKVIQDKGSYDETIPF